MPRYLSNQSTGQNTTIQLEAPLGSKLCGSTVEWIQENASGRSAGFAPFSSFQFKNCHASDSSGKDYNLHGSEKWFMHPMDGQQLCYPSNVTLDAVTINYRGIDK